ncbi:hypothetical protein [Flavobacterium sp.]|uniref:hypothetical protein n=1 Tax=Flavobacterium sp. TaxID=239 RepID=UPI003750003A
MKHLLKKFVLLSYFCLATFLYYSCTQEKEYINGQNRINFDLKEKSLKEALDMPIFNNAYSKLTKKKFSSSSSETARTALEDQFGFTIVPDVPVKIITKPDGTVFFTLLIEREVKEELKFENLMIQVKNTETSAAIFKYTMEEKAIKTMTNDYIIKEILNSQYTDLNVDGKMFFNSGGETCFDTYIWKCDYGLGYTHTAYSTCFSDNTAYPVISVVCMGDGGGPTSPDPTNGSVTVTGGGGGSPNDIIETPTPCRSVNCIEADKTPCDELKKLLIIPPAGTIPLGSKNVKQAIEDNYAEVTSPGDHDQEEGYSLLYNCSTKQMQTAPAIHVDGNKVKYYRYPYTFGGTHFHQDDLIQMLSHDDIGTLLQLHRDFGTGLSEDCKNDSNYPKPVHLMTSALGIYALTIENETLFSNTLTPIYSNNELKEDFKDKIEGMYSFNLYNSSTNVWSDDVYEYEKILLRFITNIGNEDCYNMGVGLFKAETGNDGKITGWEQLTIKKVNNSYIVERTKCL